MKTSYFRERPAAIRVHGHGSTARAAFGAIIHRIAQVMMFLTYRNSSHASSDSLIEVHMPDGQIAYVGASQHRADATPRRGVGRALQDIGHALRRSFTLQESLHMSARVYVPVRVTTYRRTRL
jgi:hypothetical protein